jgi:hypothetical protein
MRAYARQGGTATSRLSWGQENARTGDLRKTPAVVLVKGGRRRGRVGGQATKR